MGRDHLTYSMLPGHRIRPLVGAICCVKRDCPSVFTQESMSASFAIPGNTGGVQLGCVIAKRNKRDNKSRFIRGHGVVSMSKGRILGFVP